MTISDVFHGTRGLADRIFLKRTEFDQEVSLDLPELLREFQGASQHPPNYFRGFFLIGGKKPTNHFAWLS